MVWTGTEQPEANGFTGKLYPEEVLYFFDGPILFTMRMGVFRLLVYKVDEADDNDLFLVKQLQQNEVDLLKSDRLSLRGALQAPIYWLVQTNKDLTAGRTWSVTVDNLPGQYLPEPGYGLRAGYRKLPDTVLQSEAFFSVRFTGASFGRGKISFALFKQLTDRFYAASTKLLKPVVIAGLRSSEAFNLTMSEPQFASLLVAINEPEIDASFVNARNERRGILTTFDYRQEVLSRRKGFFDVFGEVTSDSNRGRSIIQAVTRYYSTIEALDGLFPGQDDVVKTTEFYANGEMAGQKVFLDAKAGGAIKEALQDARHHPRDVSGRIDIVNEKSGTFVVEDAISRKQVTCYYRRDWFDEKVSTAELRTGRSIHVFGILTTRPYRDIMDIKRAPILTKDQEDPDITF